jgi:hypothetical protein
MPKKWNEEVGDWQTISDGIDGLIREMEIYNNILFVVVDFL